MQHVKTFATPSGLRLVLNHPLLRRLVTLASSAAAAQGLTILAMPLLARLYTPADFGTFGLFLSVISIAVCFAALQYDTAIVLPRSGRSGSNLFAAALLVVLFMSVLLALAIALLLPMLNGFDAVQRLAPVLWLMPPTFLITGMFLCLLGWTLRQGDFRSIGRSRVTQSALVVLTQVGIGLLAGGTVINLAIGNMFGWAGATAMLAFAALMQGSRPFEGISLAGIGRVMRRYRKFPLIATFSAVLEMIQIHAPVLLVTLIYGPAVGGLFLVANRVALLPINMIALSVMQVMVNASSANNRSPEAIAQLLPRLLTGLVGVGALIAGLAALLSPMVFTLVFGPEWAAAGGFVQALAPLLLAQFCVIPLNAILLTSERQGLLMVSHGARVLMLLVTAWWCWAMHASAETMVVLYALTQTAIYAVSLAVIWRIGRAGAQAGVTR